MTSFFFSTPVDIDIVLEDGDDRSTVDVKLDKNRKEKAPLYLDGESVKGAVTVRPKDGRRLEHTGIKVQFIGLIGGLQWTADVVFFVSDLCLQKCSSIEATTMNSSPSARNWQHRANYNIPRPFPSISRMSRSSTSHTMASMCG